MVEKIDLINQELFYIFSENKEILKFLGKKIIETSESNHQLDKINYILRKTGELSIRSMTQSYVSWADSRGTVRVSGKEGILKNNLSNIKERSYYLPALNSPWELHISDAKTSLFSESMVLPTIMSIADQKNEIKGFLVLGLRVNHILDFIKSKVIQQDKFEYAIIHKNCNILFHNNANLLNQKINANKEYYEQQFLINYKRMIEDNEALLFMKKLHSPNLSIIALYDKRDILKEFYSYSKFKILISISIFILLTLILYIIRMVLINPIIEISTNAALISKGNGNIEFKTYHIKEMNIMTRMLRLAFNQMLEIKEQSQALKRLHERIYISDHANKRFLKSLNKNIMEAISTIIQHSGYLIEYILTKEKGLNKREIRSNINKIEEATIKLKTKVKEKLIIEYCNLQEIITEAITIVEKEAIDRDISLNIFYSNNVPSKIFFDAEKLKVMIVGLLFHSIRNSPRKSNISLIIGKIIINNNPYLKFMIEDSSFILNPEELKIVEENIGITSNDLNENILDINFTTVENIILITDSEINIYKRGSNKRQLELKVPLLQKETKYYNEKIDSKLFTNNVYPFPKRN